jgi:hypothetical protein
MPTTAPGTLQQMLTACRHGRCWRYCGRGLLSRDGLSPTQMTRLDLSMTNFAVLHNAVSAA